MSANELPNLLGTPDPSKPAGRPDPTAVVVGKREVAHQLHAAADDLRKVELHLEPGDAARLRAIIERLGELEHGLVGPSRASTDR